MFDNENVRHLVDLKIIHTLVDSWYIFFLCGNENALPSLFVIYEWRNVDWVTTICNCRNIQFQGCFIHRSLKIVILKIIHTPVHHFPLVVDSISIVLYDCWYSIPIGAHKLSTHFIWEFGPFFLGKRFKLGQVVFLASTRAFKSCYKFSMEFIPGLRPCHSRTLIPFSLNDFWTTLGVCFGSLSCWSFRWSPSQRFSADSFMFSSRIWM